MECKRECTYHEKNVSTTDLLDHGYVMSVINKVAAAVTSDFMQFMWFDSQFLSLCLWRVCPTITQCLLIVYFSTLVN